MSKRREARDRRERQRRARALALMVGVGAAAVGLAFLVLYPTLRPVGEIVTPTPALRPAAQGRVLGEPTAPVLIELYEDFQCPACTVFTRTTEPRLLQDFVATGIARLAFRQFPFIGPESLRAAEASLCADAQGRFWDYHDLLFANQAGENQGAFSDRRLSAFAESLGLDMEAFESCFNDSTYRDEVFAEFQAGRELGVNSTPTVVVNGRIVEGAAANLVPSYELIAAAIEAALAAQRAP